MTMIASMGAVGAAFIPAVLLALPIAILRWLSHRSGFRPLLNEGFVAIPHPVRLASQYYQSMLERIRAEYNRPSVTGGGNRKRMWHNIQFLRLFSAYGIIYIHLAYLFQTVHANPAILEILRIGTDLFVVVAGFLSAYILTTTGKPAGIYLKNRLIRIIPLYALFTILAFLIQNYAMTNHASTLSELFMSLAFFSYGPFPVLYPTWTLQIIIEFSLIIAAFQLISSTYGVYLSSLFVVMITSAGLIFDFQNPALNLYTNPILINFTFGILICQLVTRGYLNSISRFWRLYGSLVIIAICIVAVILRPFYWPELPRLLTLGVPASGLLLGAVMLETIDINLNSRLVDFLSRASYAMYLCHWFINIVSEKIVQEAGGGQTLTYVFLILTPIAVTIVAVAVYLYIELPMTKGLVRRLA